MATITAGFNSISLTSRRTGSKWSEGSYTAGLVFSEAVPANATVKSAKLTAAITQYPLSGPYIWLNGTAVRTRGSTTIDVSVSPGASKLDVVCTFKGNGTDNVTSIVTFNLSLAVEYELNQMPSSFTLDKATVKAGQTITATITPYRASYGHQLLCDYNGHQIATAILQPGTTAAALTIPTSWLSDIPHASSAACTVTLRCWEGSSTSFFGYTSKTVTFTLPDDAGPTVGAVSVAPLLTVGGTTYPSVIAGGYVQNKSGYSAAFSGATCKYGAVVSAYSISGGGYSGSGASFASGLLRTAGKQTITFKVVDSRGLTATKTVDITVTAYNPPQVTALSAWRVDAEGTADGMGTRGKWRAAWSFSDLGGANALTSKAYIKPVNGTETELGTLDGGDGTRWIAGTDGTKLTLEIIKRYVLRVALTDAYGTVERTVEIPSAHFAMHMNAKGNGICIGGASTMEDAVEIPAEYDLGFKGERYKRLPNVLDSYPVGAIYISGVSTSPAALFGGTWEQIKGRFLLGTGTNEANSTNKWGKLSAGAYNAAAGEKGGAAQITLKTAQMPTHSHLFERIPITQLEMTTGGNYYAEQSTTVGSLVKTQTTYPAGEGKAHSNMPPYLAVYIWQRTA